MASKMRMQYEETSPATDPRIAKVFPQRLAKALFFRRPKDPAAPREKNRSERKKLD
ncbi:MAG: hypothetical protein Q7R55_00975 [Candidatus Wildermuthbacteria bacterium]|nr:hypothetical protein [Candidatus Wildermuthbacteria bacterium]